MDHLRSSQPHRPLPRCRLRYRLGQSHPPPSPPGEAPRKTTSTPCDQGHIAYHAIGRIPIRGRPLAPAQPSPVPVGALAPGSQWSGYIPFDQLPQVLDPPSGVLATANARITPDNYAFPITTDWSDPYRNERIWKVLIPSQHLTPANMLHLQTDVYSDVDHVIAQRLAYAIDHSDIANAGSSKLPNTHPTSDERRLRAAADILRNWNGNVESNAVAPAIVDAARDALWPMLLAPRLGTAWRLYTWGEKNYAEEQIIMHAPARWLPKPYTSWDNLLAAAVKNALIEARAPSNLAKWTYGPLHPVDIENPLFAISPIIPAVIGIPTGTGAQPQSGDTTTVKQVRRDFGPSERFTADLSDLDHSTLNLVLGQAGDPASPWFMDQWPAWYHGTTFALPYSTAAVQQATAHTLTLTASITMNPIVTSVSRSATYTFSKPTQPNIRLLTALGVEGDAHLGVTVKHRSRMRKDPTRPNLRQVHLIHSELIEELNAIGFTIQPGLLGENITTANIDLLNLPTGTRLAIGPQAIVEVTGLRNPCQQLNDLQPGLMDACMIDAAENKKIARAGIMAVVLQGGLITPPGDSIQITLPPEPHTPLTYV